MVSSLLDEVLQEPKSQDVGFVFLKAGLLREPGLMDSCIKRLNEWGLRHIIVYVCQDALEANNDDEAARPLAAWNSFYNLLGAVGRMETLRHLQITQQGTGRMHCPMPVQWIANLLTYAGDRLERLELSNVRLQGTVQAHAKFAQSIEKLTSLKSCSLKGIVPLNDKISDHFKGHCPPDVLTGALLKLPALVDVALESPHFTCLQPQEFDVWTDKQYFQRTEKLQLALPFDAVGSVSVLSLVVLRSNLLQSLEIQMVRLESSEQNPAVQETLQAAMMDLAVAIGSSFSLHTVKLLGEPLSSKIIDPFLVQVARKLATNPASKLQTFHATSGAGSCRPCVGAAWRDLLQSNLTLQDYKVFCHYQINEGQVQTLDSTMRTEIDFILSLNRNGRKLLLQNDNVHREEWLKTFSMQAAQNLDILYYYLRSNPWLLQSSAGSCLTFNNNKKGKKLEENQEFEREKRALEIENQMLKEELALLKAKKSSRKGGLRRLRRVKLWRKSTV